MATIREISNGNYFDDYYTGKNSNYANAFLSGLNVNNDNSSSFSLTDYAMIKKGTYGKLMKAYYAQEKAGKAASGDSASKLSLMAGNAGSLARSTQALMQTSLWEKKKITEKDEKTGEEKTVKCVYVLSGNVVKLKYIDILFNGGDFVIAKSNTTQTGYVRLYDRVIIKGDDLSDGKIVKYRPSN